MKEIFKQIKSYEGLYSISNLGRVYAHVTPTKHSTGSTAIRKGRFFSSRKNHKCYHSAGLTKNSKRTQHRVHRLVACAFIPNPENKPFINHINGIKNDNRAINLEWCTHKENMRHAYDNGLLLNHPGARSNGFKGRVIATCISSGKEIVMYGKKEIIKSGFNQGAVSACVLGKRKTHKGFKFKMIPKT